MSHLAPASFSSRVVRRIVLLVALGAVAAVLAPCKLIEDQMTDSEFWRGRNGECLEACAQSVQDSLDVENWWHVENMENCGDKRQCKRDERERHRIALLRIKDWGRQCRQNCHHQGGGHGGGN
ncbi:MAG: hypothetical protein HOP12_09625 [Candidatus Eisenbacteria bacterium]|uniref:Uncharacterized protein n=1 Tax=Eiseniibacteriota bacterium TaxID=2212470 RepID=A0A849SQZ2_UNCEI|nr:hypothetical protein [Candidatus Eisenbacteria bacterium]